MTPLRVLVILTLLFGSLPFALYLGAQMTGALPSPEDWMAQGYNHGPWRWELLGFTLGYPLAVLGIVTVAVSAWQALHRRRLSPAATGSAILVLQAVILLVQFQTIWWTVD